MTDPSLLNPAISERFPDRDLLRRFIHDADEKAFGQIVERHASLVMSVCLRVVGQSADAEDAFQATFFALSRRPHSIYECRSLSGWLYSVAWRTSVRLVRLRKRTMMHPLPEQTPATEPDPLNRIAESSNLAALDEELNELPEKYRDVLVMSYFAQQTNQEIADQLNESKGAIDGRIRDARRLLRVRLTRRGVDIGVLTLATAMTQSVAAAVSPALIQTTVRFGSLTPELTGKETVPGVDLAQMQLLTSTGTVLMSAKTGFAVVAGILLLSGAFGLARIAATQDATVSGEGSSGVAHLEVSSGDGADSSLSSTDAAVLVDFPAVTGVAPVTFNVGGRQAPKNSTTSSQKKSGAIAEFSRGSARAAERQLNELMSTARIPALNYPGDESLGEVLKFLAEHLSESRGEKLLILLDEKDPDVGEDADFLESTTVRDVNLPRDSMTIASALDLIFAKVKDQKLTWIAKDDVILITTTQSAESENHLILRSYDITGLRGLKFPSTEAVPVSRGLGGPGLGYGGLRPGDDPATKSDLKPATKFQEPIEELSPRPRGLPEIKMPNTWEFGLMAIIHEMTSPPCLWIQNGDDIGSMSVAGNRLFVRQTRTGHEKIVEVLDELELAAEEMEDAGVSESSPAAAFR